MGLKRFTPQTSIPIKGDKDDKYNPNWLALQRGISAVGPVCVGAAGDPGSLPAGHPGGFATVVWTPTANVLNDQTQMIGRSATTNLHIPVDGYYDFYLFWRTGDVITNETEFECRMEVAPTSDSGYGVPVFAEPFAGIRPSRHYHVGTNLDRVFVALYRGVEFHANDLVRFRVRIDSDQQLTSMTVSTSEFRLTYPIPNKGPI